MNLVPSDRIRQGAALALVVAGLASPIVVGATEVWAYCALQILVALVGSALALSGTVRSRVRWLLPALALFGAAQVFPLPESWLSRVAPLSAEARKSAQPIIGYPAIRCAAVDRTNALAALRRCLTLVLLATLIADLARDEQLRRWLTKGVATAGVITLLLGLIAGDSPGYNILGLHDMSGFYRDYKSPLLTAFHSEGVGYGDEVRVGAITYIENSAVAGSSLGTMVNPNHFAACVGLTLPVIAGLLAGLPGRRAWPWRLLSAGYSLLAAYTVAVVAHSRGGIAAIIGSGLLAALFASMHTRRRAFVLLVPLAIAGVLLVVRASQFGFLERLGGRLGAWTVALEMFQSSPWLGIGLGNYGAAYPAFRDGPVIYLAHNVWVEWAAEGGLAGLLLVTACVGWLAWCGLRVWNWRATGSRRVMRSGVIAGLLFAALHGAVDHGIQIPANAWLCATLVGLLVGDLVSENELSGSAGDRGAGTGPRREGPVAFLAAVRSLRLERLLVLVCAGWLIWGGWREARADWLIRPLREALMYQHPPEVQFPPQPSPNTRERQRAWQQQVQALRDERARLQEQRRELIVAALPDAERACRIFPQSAEYAGYVAQGYLHLSRGEAGRELDAAYDWFRRSLALRPLNPWVRRTLNDFRRRNQQVHKEHEESAHNALDAGL
ncbi:MAG: O-antigen ligase family protein [Planctomycetaceae bacterium]